MEPVHWARAVGSKVASRSANANRVSMVGWRGVLVSVKCRGLTEQRRGVLFSLFKGIETVTSERIAKNSSVL